MRKLLAMIGVITLLGIGIANASEEAPPWWEQEEETATRDRCGVADHRDDNVTDHRDENRCDQREDPGASSDAGNEVVPARRGTPPVGDRPGTATEPSENAPLHTGLEAPSILAVGGVTSTTLVLYWQDNSTREFGVELYRMDPVAARRTGAPNWEFVGLFEERRDTFVTGTGARSDEDFDLSPETNYCYRMRAYVGFDRSEVSSFSETICTLTEQ